MLCPQCGRRIFKREAFCPRCGASISTERKNTEGESNLKQRFRKFSYAADNSKSTESQPSTAEHPPYAPAPAETPTCNPTEQPKQPSDELPPSVPIHEIEFKPVTKPVVNPSDDGKLHSETNDRPEFYGSYGEICNDEVKPNLQPEPDLLEFTPVFSTDVPVEKAPVQDEFPLKENSDAPLLENAAAEKIEFDENAPLNPISSDSEDDELVLPDLINGFTQNTNNSDFSKKSIDYEDTVKLENAGKAYKNEEVPVASSTTTPTSKREKIVRNGKYKAAASSRVELVLKEGQIPVAITPKEFKQLKSKKLRGLGIICTLCLVIIASVCIWSYVDSFADPLVGRWKGDMKSSDIPIEAIQQLDQDILNSTWEFSSSGSVYLSITVNDTPISFSGTYVKQHDENGEQYLTITLDNPMDGSKYTLNVYYTVTGKILEFNDMEGFGMTIDLTRE